MADYPNNGLLVDAPWLAQHLEDPDVRIIDTRGAGRYAEGHIKNAVNFPVARLDDPSKPGQAVLIPPERLNTVLGNFGIGNDDLIVFYDDGLSNMSSRAFWALDYYGHGRMAVLNGGLAAWLSHNQPLSRDLSEPQPKTYQATPHPDRGVDKAYIKERIGKADTLLLDVRTEEEFSGAMGHAMRAGHIPGAKHLDWFAALRPEQVTTFKDADEIAELLSEAGASPDKEVIVYCQSGMRASHTYYVLRLMGYDKVSNYPGSMGEWAADPSLPMEQGK